MKFRALTLLLLLSSPFIETRLYSQQLPAPFFSETETPEQHLKRVERLAKSGDKEAAYELGQICAFGFPAKPDEMYRPQDLELARHWFEIGADTPYEKSQVALMYANGNPFPKNLEMAEHWYRSAGETVYLFEAGETYKAAAEADASQASKYYPKATAIYLELLQKTGDPNRRRAQLELGNFVIDGIYSAGQDAKGRKQNMVWARMIAQELVGQKLYQIAVAYELGQDGLTKDKKMWLRYVKRAAAYNIDNAQHFYVEAMNNGEVPDPSGYDYIAWPRIENDSNNRNALLLNALTRGMTEVQLKAADAAYRALVDARQRYGAFYVADDLMRDPSPSELKAMDQEDPDVQLRQAFAMESAAATNSNAYERVIDFYRTVRNHRDSDCRFVLGRYALLGTNGVPKDRKVAAYWLREAINSGSKPAQALLDRINKQ
jgi:TPR repeat protein